MNEQSAKKTLDNMAEFSKRVLVDRPKAIRLAVDRENFELALSEIYMKDFTDIQLAFVHGDTDLLGHYVHKRLVEILLENEDE